MAGVVTISEHTVSATASVLDYPVTVTENQIVLVPIEQIDVSVDFAAWEVAIAIHNMDPYAHADIQARMLQTVTDPIDDALVVTTHSGHIKNGPCKSSFIPCGAWGDAGPIREIFNGY